MLGSTNSYGSKAVNTSAHRAPVPTTAAFWSRDNVVDANLLKDIKTPQLTPVTELARLFFRLLEAETMVLRLFNL